MSDPIPLEKCFEAGCDKVVLILTRPKDYERDPRKDEIATKLIQGKYPEAARTMSKRAIIYNTELWLAKKYEEQGKVLIVAPDDIGGMKTLKRDKDAIDLLYRKGFADAEAIRKFVE